jgi:type III restriction enzyme
LDAWNPLGSVNNLGNYGRWAFAEFTEIFEIEADFSRLIETHIWAFD